MNNYLVLLFGFIIGQMTLTVIGSYFLQRTKEGIDFPQAIKVFMHKEVGNYAVAICGLIILMFMLSDYVDPKLTRAELLTKAALTWREKAIVYSRTFSVVFGCFSQFILLLAFKRGIKGINEYAAKNGVSDISDPNLPKP